MSARGEIKERPTASGKKYDARIDTGTRPGSTERPRESKTFDSRPEAQAWLDEMWMARKRGTAVAKTASTLGAYLIDTYIAGKASDLKPTTINMYRDHFERYILPELGNVKLQSLTPVMLKKNFDAARTRNIGKVSHRLLHTALKEAVFLGLLAANPVERVKSPRAPKPKRGWWEDAQAFRFLDAAKDDAYQPLWTLALYTGMRRGELLGLRWEDVDLDAGTLHVQSQIVDLAGKRSRQTPKTEHGDRTIDLPPVVVATLRGHRAKQAAQAATAADTAARAAVRGVRPSEQAIIAAAALEGRTLGTRVWRDEDLVCASAIGTAICPRNADRQFHKLREAAGLPPITLHGLRHTAASLMRANGAELHEVSEILGHSSPTVTAAIYSHATIERRRKALQGLADTLGSREGKTVQASP